MMIIIEEWMKPLSDKLKTNFGERLLFVGLQGSYQRDEATKDSDIDAVVILDSLTLDDLEKYKDIVSSMPEHEKACGFISGEKEMKNWPKHELFQFKNDTRSYYGDLDELLQTIDRMDIINGEKIGASNLYHFCCHNYVHGEMQALKEIYKGAFFVLQSAYFLRNNIYIGNKERLLPLLDGVEQDILSISKNWCSVEDKISTNPNEYFKLILQWCSGIMTEEF